MRELNNQIVTANNLLEGTNSRMEEEQIELKVGQKTLDQFRQISNLLAIHEYPEFSTLYGDVVHFLIDIKELGLDPKIMLSKYENFESLTKEIERLEKKLQEWEKLLQHYRLKSDEEEARWKDYDNYFEVFTRLTKDGLKPEDIFMVAHVLKNDFPKSEIKQLIEYILTYGNLAAAKLKLERESKEEA